MEKVIVDTQPRGGFTSSSTVKEINEYLARGWTVKFVTMSSTKDDTTAIYVLEKRTP